MSLALLLDSLVRESATLLAATATHKGARTQLGGLADRMFFGVAEELQKLDVKRRVCADMFGMAPRAYIRKVRRVEESETDQGRSLWASAYEYLVANGEVSWSGISNRFPRDDEEILRGVLRDLTESGLIVTKGRAASAVYSAVASAEIVDQDLGRHVTRELLWALIYRDGPITQSDLQRRASIAPKIFDATVAQLLASGRVTAEEKDGERLYRSELFSPEQGKREGWEGAIFDHFHAVVKTLSTFLSRPELGASAASTYTFDLGPDHPMADEVKALFVDLRARATALRTKIDTYNSEHPLSEPQRTILYLGLCKDVPEVARSTDDDDE
jgi:hypothetical protein